MLLHEVRFKMLCKRQMKQTPALHVVHIATKFVSSDNNNIYKMQHSTM